MGSAYQITRKKCIAAMISSFVAAVCVCIGVTMNLTTLYV